MASLRRRDDRRLFGVAVATVVGGEAPAGIALLPGGKPPTLPVVPWLAIPILGRACGRRVGGVPTHRPSAAATPKPRSTPQSPAFRRRKVGMS